MNFQSIALADQEIELHGHKLLWLPALKLLCASDIHFEKGSFFSRFGSLIPPYDTQETLDGLETAVKQFQPDLFIALGDSFHDANAVERLTHDNRQRLIRLIGSVKRWIWITGNHDPDIAATLPGERHEALSLSGIWFRHETKGDKTTPEISGHYHPKAKLVLAGSRITSACFVRVQHNIIMPAYGHYTGGLGLDDPALIKIAPPDQRQVYLVYENHVYKI